LARRRLPRTRAPRLVAHLFATRSLRRLSSLRLRGALHLTAFGVLLRGSQALISLINVVLLAHVLGPAGRGEYFLFVAAVALLARLVDLGMSPSAVVFASRYPGALDGIHRRLIAGIAALWLVALFVGFVLLTVAQRAFGDLPQERVALAFAVLPLAIYEQVWVHLMVGIRRVVTMNVVQACAGVAMLLGNVAFVVVVPGGVTAAVLVYAGVLLLKTPLMGVLAWRASARTDTGEPVPSLRELISFSLRGYPNALAALSWSRVPAFVLDFVHGAGAVGLFSVAQQVLEQLQLPVQATQDAIYQNIARLPRDTATSAMNRYLRTGVWTMLPLVLICGILAPWAVPLVFGSAFAGSAQVFQILLISLLASVVPALLSPYFFGQLQRPGLASSVAWIRVALALSLSFALAQPFAELGVATALAVADVCSTLLILGLYVRIAATSVRLAILPRYSDFGEVLRRA
jgi:O-antigen/teichoic acid export membrane protein